jgi:ribosomal protein L9
MLARSSHLVPKGARGLHTRPKIAVQLLKSWPGLGSAGEIVRVAPGRMRNELHPNNGAAYVLKGVPLKVPLKTRESAELERKALREQLQAEQPVEATRQEKIGAESILESLGISGEASNLEFLKFPSDSAKAGSASLFSVQTALNSLPPVIRLNRKAKSTGFLESYLTNIDFAAYVSKLIGVEVPANSVVFDVPRKTDRLRTVEKSELLDHVGSYIIQFKLSPEMIIRRKIEVVGGENVENKIRDPTVPLPTEAEASSATASKSSDDTSSGQPTTESSAPSKSFDWENDLLVKLQDKMKK